MRFGFREFIFLIVLLAVPAVSLFYVFQPRNREIRQALDEMRVKQARLDRLAEVTSKIADIGLAIEEGRESIGFIEAKLPTDKNVEGVLEEVWAITSKNGLTVKSVKTKKTKPTAIYSELPLEMALVGDFDGFYRFLLQVEALPRITRLHKLKLKRATSNLRAPQDDRTAGSMKADLTLSIYFESGDEIQ